MASQRTPWIIPRIWPDSTVYIIGGGPSIMGMNLEVIRNKRVIGTNHAFQLYPWVDVLYFGDCQFRSMAPLDAWPGIKVTSCGRVPLLGQGWRGIRRIGRAKNYGIEHDKPGFVAWNDNTGASAINIAYWLGASCVVLIGFDMHPAGKRHNYHDLYPARARGYDPYKKHMRCWPYIARDAKALGMEIINATPGSAITDFECKPLGETV